MLIITKRELINTVAEKWKYQYFSSGKWGKYNGDPEDVYKQLCALGNDATEEDVSRIIGNDSWTRNKCNECNLDCEIIVRLGELPDYDSATACVCRDCLLKANKAINELLST